MKNMKRMKRMKDIRGFLQAVNQNMRLGKVVSDNCDSDFLRFHTEEHRRDDGYCSVVGLNYSSLYYSLVSRLAKKWFKIRGKVGFNNTGSHFWFYVKE